MEEVMVARGEKDEIGRCTRSISWPGFDFTLQQWSYLYITAVKYPSLSLYSSHLLYCPQRVDRTDAASGTRHSKTEPPHPLSMGASNLSCLQKVVTVPASSYAHLLMWLI